MKLRQFGIGTMMGLVAIVALDFWVLRLCYPLLKPGVYRAWVYLTPNHIVTQREMLVRGALPMANILAIGLLFVLRRRGGHPSLPGFVGFGVLALVTYSCWAIFVFPSHYRYDDLSKLLQYHWLVPGFIGSRHALRQIATSVVLVLPQLTLAVVGGFLSRQFLNGRGKTQSRVAAGEIAA